MRKCTNCGGMIPDNAKFCLECGSKVEALVPTCPNCGEEVPKGKFCPNCGASMTTVKATFTKTETLEFEATQKTVKGVFDEDYFSSPSSSKKTKKFDDSFEDLLDTKIKQKKESEVKEKLSSFKYEEYSKGKYIITKFVDFLEVVVEVPSEVIAIADNAFEDSDIIEIKLSEGIKSIGKRAFANCKHLKKINFPKSLKKIGDEAFYNCSKLNVEIPSSVEIVGDNLFNKKEEAKQANPEPQNNQNAQPRIYEGNKIVYYDCYLSYYGNYSDELFKLLLKYGYEDNSNLVDLITNAKTVCIFLKSNASYDEVLEMRKEFKKVNAFVMIKAFWTDLDYSKRKAYDEVEMMYQNKFGEPYESQWFINEYTQNLNLRIRDMQNANEDVIKILQEMEVCSYDEARGILNFQNYGFSRYFSMNEIKLYAQKLNDLGFISQFDVIKFSNSELFMSATSTTDELFCIRGYFNYNKQDYAALTLIDNDEWVTSGYLDFYKFDKLSDQCFSYTMVEDDELNNKLLNAYEKYVLPNLNKK